MGNSGSQATEATPVQHWTTQSYPRPAQHKMLLNPRRVLPDARATRLARLRPTDNGEILYNGGTLTGRQLQQRASSAQSTEESNNSELIRFGSVPDLRLERVVVRPTGGGGRSGARKKYRAPQPPAAPMVSQHNHGDTSQDSWEVTSIGETSDEPMRRARLFKTRAEMKRKPAAGCATADLPTPVCATVSKPLVELPRSKSLPEFQAELQAATNRLRQQRDRDQERGAPNHARAPPANTFYFGMEVSEAPADRCHDDAGSDDDYDCEVSTDDIALNLRPILPKKQLQVPRFSPAAAWRQLATDCSSRAPPPLEHPVHIVTCDSTEQFDCQEQVQTVASWTPEQDLEGEDDTTSDEDAASIAGKAAMTAKFSARSVHVFSLSLPRDNQLAAYMDEKSWHARHQHQQQQQAYHNTQQQQQQQQSAAVNQSDNWFLSRSAPNSLGNVGVGQTSIEHESGRLMYLPAANGSGVACSVRTRTREVTPPPSKPQNLQDPTPSSPQTGVVSAALTTGGKAGRRFTFQSTVRQIERRRLAERLSREAERKERQRLSELAAMQRVEEEFQRKRAREKASIRHQLRLYSMDPTSVAADTTSTLDDAPPLSSSPPPPLTRRADPDGSDSPTTVDSPRATQVLSEYRLPRREYKEWQTTSGSALNGGGGALATTVAAAATVHPKVVCDMPRATAHHRQDHASNYRRNFAHGVRPHAKCIS